MAIELDDGTIIRSLPEQVSYNDERIIENRQDIDTLTARVEAALAGVFHYKGSVATYANLPATGNEVGDVWNVIDTGKNYAWSGSAWDDLGGIVDLSNLVTLNTNQTITGTKTISNTYLGFADSGSAAYIEKTQDGLEIDMDGSASYIFGDQGDVYAQGGSALTIGTHDNPWDRAHITKYMQANNTTYGFTLPDSTSLTADSELLDTLSDQTIAGVKTFSNGIKIGDQELKETGGGANLELKPISSLIINASYFRPFTTNSIDLGTSSYAWKDLYLAGSLRLGASGVIKYSSGGINANDDFFATNPSISLGKPAFHWNNLYLAGNLINGSNQVSIDDLKALIDYAKAQGWIS